MSQLFRFTSAVRRDPSIEIWMREHSGELGAIGALIYSALLSIAIRMMIGWTYIKSGLKEYTVK